MRLISWKGGRSIFELDLRSRLPIYEQLVERFKELIIREVLKTDEQVPSVRVLAKQLTINPNTIQKAYAELENQGYLYSVPGKGSFVAGVVLKPQSEKLAALKKELIKITSEMMFLGLEKEEIIRIIGQTEEMVKGGETGAENEKCK